MIIYKTTNLINGKFYVGQDRKNNPQYYGSGWKLKQAIKRYGKGNFRKEILEVCTKATLDECEIHWITKLDARNPKVGYNILKGGFALGAGPDHPSFGSHNTEEQKAAMSRARKGVPRLQWVIDKMKAHVKTKEHGQHISEAKKGVTVITEKHKQQNRAALLGRVFSVASRKKMSKGRKKVWLSRRAKVYGEEIAKLCPDGIRQNWNALTQAQKKVILDRRERKRIWVSIFFHMLILQEFQKGTLNLEEVI